MTASRRCAMQFVLACVVLVSSGRNAPANEPPVAEAGFSRYAASDPVQLDGTASYDPDGSGTLGFAWRQIAGSAVVLTDADTAGPTITGFVQTNDVQECEFELVVSDGEMTSPPDTVAVVIVPDFGPTALRQENPPFDPNKPTVIYFGGGNCYNGSIDLSWSAWHELANVISFPNGYVQDSTKAHSWHTYYGCRFHFTYRVTQSSEAVCRYPRIPSTIQI